MNTILNYSATNSFSLLYNILSHSKSKDKCEMVLEPLQAMIQLSLLSVSSVGTKLRISENILHLHTPDLTQPIIRWYNADKKDDLYFLYSVIKRFIKWYNPQVNKNSPITLELYQLIASMTIQGLQNLFKTYSSSDSNTIIHVIQMYKNLLEYNNDKILLDEYLVNVDNSKINIDEVFEKIIIIYEPDILAVIFSTLTLLRNETELPYQFAIIDGLNMIMSKTHRIIHEWINTHLIL
jgi:hypothetical protein